VCGVVWCGVWCGVVCCGGEEEDEGEGGTLCDLFIKLFFIISFSPGLLPTLDPLTGPKAGVGGFPLNYTYPPFLALQERRRG
jgi:hypothetical protein